LEIKWTPWRATYIKGDSSVEEPGCPLCNAYRAGDDARKLVLYRGESTFVILNLYPYNPGHLMIVPYAHTADYGALPDASTGEMMRLSLVATLAMIIALTSCAPPLSGVARPRDSARITQEEVDESHEASAYDVIVKLRPNFLMSRGSTSLRPDDSRLPAVFLDGIEHGPISSLRNIPASNIAEIRLYRSWEATTQFGTGYMSGVIAVKTRR